MKSRIVMALAATALLSLGASAQVGRGYAREGFRDQSFRRREVVTHERFVERRFIDRRPLWREREHERIECLRPVRRRW